VSVIALPEEGTEIDGFRLGELMHNGSMASIHRLSGPDGPLPLIIKIPRLGIGERAVNVISFEVCRMVLGALAQSHHHPTLVAHGDVETTPYLVMEHVEGRRLSEWVDRAPCPPDEVASVGAAVAVALHDIHRQDVVHLDLKPTNVLFRASGEAVLIDFGLSHHSHYPDLLAEELRYPVGNWVYMAPEQVLGVRCDPRSDIYALGAMLYELATGRKPFGHPATLAKLRARLRRNPLPPRAIVQATPAWLQEIILHCLEIDARDRYGSAADVALELSRPERVEVTERGMRTRGDSWRKQLRLWLRARTFEPAPCPAPSMALGLAPTILVAIGPEHGDDASEAMRDEARRLLAANERYRIACATVVPPAAALSGEREEETATGRHIKHLVSLRRWAKPLDLPEERVTYHVLESEKPAMALLDYAKVNDVDRILIGGPRGSASARLFPGVAFQVAAEAPCSVTIVRPQPDS
jgi:nucleotide-binding universal stress UspA family protein